MKLGTNDIGSVYLGTNAVQSVYLGSDLVYSAFSGGLLDTYTGAAAAYSLRRLSSSYTGKAIRVRRANDNSEQDIGFVGEDLNTSALTTFCSGTNGFVKTWYDQSGNGNDATQATASNQPQIVSSGSVILENGKPSLSFDGSDDFFNLTSSISTVVDYTSFQVVKRNSTSSNSITMAGINIGDSYLAWNFNDNNVYLRNSRGYITTSLNLINQTLFTSLNIQSGNMTIYQDGTSLVSGSPTPFLGTGSMDAIGRRSSDYGIGTTQEIIYYNSDQSSNRTGIQTNINANYQIYWDGSQTSLLDTYGGSAAAYSLRALSSAYTGPLVRVRRASDNAEQDIYAKYDGTLNVSALESFCSGTNGFVKTWYDQSGNGRDATQTTAANQPQIVSSGSVITDLSNKPSLKFSGNQWIHHDSTFTINQPYTNFTTSRFISITTPDTFPYLWRSKLGNDTNLVLMGVFGKSLRIYAGANGFSSITPTTNTNYLIYGLYNGSSSIISVNTSDASVNTGSNPLTNGISFGVYNTSSGQLNGYMSESIFYPTDQSSNRTGIETNINDFYSIY